MLTLVNMNYCGGFLKRSCVVCRIRSVTQFITFYSDKKWRNAHDNNGVFCRNLYCRSIWHIFERYNWRWAIGTNRGIYDHFLPTGLRCCLDPCMAFFTVRTSIWCGSGCHWISGSRYVLFLDINLQNNTGCMLMLRFCEVHDATFGQFSPGRVYETVGLRYLPSLCTPNSTLS